MSVSDRILSSTRILESKIYEARNKKDLLKARAQSAKTAKEVNEVLGSVDTTSALSAYKRMEEKGIYFRHCEIYRVSQVYHMRRVYEWKISFEFDIPFSGLSACIHHIIYIANLNAL